ncbi:MAG: PadR family transcriptional regulator [Actinomycetota bacterium]
MRQELAKGHLDLLLLGVLEAGPSHGYGVIEKVRDRSSETFDLPEGSVYPALHRLERQGFLRSQWEQGARRRRTYRLTRRGRAELARQRGEWKSFSRAVRSVAAPVS